MGLSGTKSEKPTDEGITLGKDQKYAAASPKAKWWIVMLIK